jgi:hypothetical protein
LKITRKSYSVFLFQISDLDCVDNAGGVVALGEYFMQRNEKGEHESMECVGNEESAKKVVFKCESFKPLSIFKLPLKPLRE